MSSDELCVLLIDSGLALKTVKQSLLISLKHILRRGAVCSAGRSFGGIARFAFRVATQPLWFMPLGVHGFTVKNRGLIKMRTLSASKNTISISKFAVCLTYFLLMLFFNFFFKQQARAEQEEEFISNTLFKKIQALQKEKETLAVNYEKEEEFLTNELSRKLMQVNLSFLALHLPCLFSSPGENDFDRALCLKHSLMGL